MQCHAIVLDTTGTTYARQKPRYIEREKKVKERKERKEITRKNYEPQGKTKEGKEKYPDLDTRWMRNKVLPPQRRCDR